MKAIKASFPSFLFSLVRLANMCDVFENFPNAIMIFHTEKKGSKAQRHCATLAKPAEKYEMKGKLDKDKTKMRDENIFEAQYSHRIRLSVKIRKWDKSESYEGRENKWFKQVWQCASHTHDKW